MATWALYNNIFVDRATIRVQRRQVESNGFYLHTVVTVHIRGSYSPGYVSYALNKLPAQLQTIRLTGQAVGNLAQAVGALAAGGFGEGGRAFDPVSLANAVGQLASAAGVPRPQPQRTPGAPAPVTDNAVKYALSQPRKRFIMGDGPTVMYDVPRPPLTVDVDNGPKAVAHDVVEVEGHKAFLVDFVITFSVNEVDSTNRGTVPVIKENGLQSGTRNIAVSPYRVSPLLAHEWSSHQEIDQDFFTTRTIEGRAVFRSDVLDREKLIPDQLRYWLGHPVPARFNRQRVTVKALPDGRTVLYSILDRERVIPVDPNVVTRIEATLTQNIRHEGLEALLGRQTWTVQDRHGRSQWNTGWSGGIAQIGLIAAIQGAPMIINGFRRMGQGGGFSGFNIHDFAGIPVTIWNVTGRVWGHPSKSYRILLAYVERFVRRQITTGGDGILFEPGAERPGPVGNVIGPADLGFALGDAPAAIAQGLMLGTEVYDTRIDLAGKFIEFSMTMIGSVLTGTIRRIASAGRPNQDPGVVPAGQPPEPRPIHAHPMRGVYLGAAVARALKDTETPWTPPGDPPNVDDTNNPRPVAANDRRDVADVNPEARNGTVPGIPRP